MRRIWRALGDKMETLAATETKALMFGSDAVLMLLAEKGRRTIEDIEKTKSEQQNRLGVLRPENLQELDESIRDHRRRIGLMTGTVVLRNSGEFANLAATEAA